MYKLHCVERSKPYVRHSTEFEFHVYSVQLQPVSQEPPAQGAERRMTRCFSCFCFTSAQRPAAAPPAGARDGTRSAGGGASANCVRFVKFGDGVLALLRFTAVR